LNTKLSLHVNIDDLTKVRKDLCDYFEIIEAYDSSGIYKDELNDFSSQVIFTNPNSCPIYYSTEHLQKYFQLKTIVTASTGTIHIDFSATRSLGISVISITNEYEVLNKITSTAEHALALTLAALRKIPQSVKSVEEGKWNYQPFIGRQINCLRFGVIGFGRLGSMYADFLKKLGGEILIHDPYKIDQIKQKGFKHASLLELAKISDVISIHCHVNDETTNMINSDFIGELKSGAIIINTARGEIVSEYDLCNHLKTKEFFYFTDVLSSEFLGLKNNPLFNSPYFMRNIFITPHQGGMTFDARKLAYQRAADLLLDHCSNLS